MLLNSAINYLEKRLKRLKKKRASIEVDLSYNRETIEEQRLVDKLLDINEEIFSIEEALNYLRESMYEENS